MKSEDWRRESEWDAKSKSLVEKSSWSVESRLFESESESEFESEFESESEYEFELKSEFKLFIFLNRSHSSSRSRNPCEIAIQAATTVVTEDDAVAEAKKL